MVGMKRDDHGEVAERCGIHHFARAAGRCRACESAYCNECLVYPNGRRRQPLCVPCALVVAGIRRRPR